MLLEKLTPAERTVFNLMEFNNPKIAELLCISPHSVEQHIKHIYSKFMIPEDSVKRVWMALHGGDYLNK